MAEIYVKQASPVKFKLYWGGEITDADNDVTATVKEALPSGSLSATIATYTATKLETDIGTYEITIPHTIADQPKNLRIEWTYSVDGSTSSNIQIVDIVTPYVNIYDVIDDLNIGTDPSDPNHKTYNDLQQAEKYARKLIEAYTNQVFYWYPGTQITQGYGSDILPLPIRIEQITKLYEEDVKVFDSALATNNWFYTPIVSESNYGVRVNLQDLQDDTIYSANGMVTPSVNNRGYSGTFKKDLRYKVEGIFGWNYVPDNVKEASKILMKQYFEQDRAWKDKYVKNISTFDWKFEFMQDAHRGTGNLYADQLLAPYVTNGMVVF
jgi:hypothetical protein